MKKIVWIGSLLFSISCHNEKLQPNTCQSKDPLNELGWIKDSVAQYSLGDVTVYQASYQNQTVFSIESFLGPDAATATLYRCDGSIICKSFVTIAGLSGNCGGISDQLTNSNVIFKKPR